MHHGFFSFIRGPKAQLSLNLLTPIKLIVPLIFYYLDFFLYLLIIFMVFWNIFSLNFRSSFLMRPIYTFLYDFLCTNSCILHAVPLSLKEASDHIDSIYYVFCGDYFRARILMHIFSWFNWWVWLCQWRDNEICWNVTFLVIVRHKSEGIV